MTDDIARTRAIDAVVDRTVLGPDPQVDRKAVVVEPGRWAEHDPFLLMFEDWFSSVGFDWHPHRGIETVTFVLDGELEHRDNSGGHGVLGPGDAQWMTAGRGIVHAELARGGQPVHTLQLWVNLPADEKMTEPGYQDLRRDAVPVRREDGVEAHVYSGASGDVTGPARNQVPLTMVDARLDPGARFTQELPAAANGFAYVLEGDGRFGSGSTSARAGQVAWLDRAEGDGGSSRFQVTTDDGVRFLLFAGPPLHEPVVAHGPFVMNTRDQILDAFEDFRAGRFGPIPA